MGSSYESSRCYRDDVDATLVAVLLELVSFFTLKEEERTALKASLECGAHVFTLLPTYARAVVPR